MKKLFRFKKLLILSCSSFIAASIIIGTASAEQSKITLLTDSSQIKRVTCGNGAERKTVITLPNDTKVIKNKGEEAPYCLIGCDVPIDCEGNHPNESNQQWKCINAKGACIGKCVRVN